MLFIKMMHDGGPLMWVILVCALLALTVFLTKVFQFHRDEINVRELLHGLTNVLRRDGLVEALTLCDSTPGPTARLMSAAILAYQPLVFDLLRERVPRVRVGRDGLVKGFDLRVEICNLGGMVVRRVGCQLVDLVRELLPI